jgi:hypothetical protein
MMPTTLPPLKQMHKLYTDLGHALYAHSCGDPLPWGFWTRLAEATYHEQIDEYGAVCPVRGYSRAHVSAIMQGKREYNGAVLGCIASALGWTEQEIINFIKTQKVGRPNGEEDNASIR